MTGRENGKEEPTEMEGPTEMEEPTEIDHDERKSYARFVV